MLGGADRSARKRLRIQVPPNGSRIRMTVAVESWIALPSSGLTRAAAGFFFLFRADTIEERAAKIKMKCRNVPMPPGKLSVRAINKRG
jgi:hypothetical protein